VGPRAGLDIEVKGKILLPLPGIEPRSPSYPVRSQTILTEYLSIRYSNFSYIIIVKDNENSLSISKNSARRGFLLLGSHRKTILGARKETIWTTLLYNIKFPRETAGPLDPSWWGDVLCAIFSVPA
jgi:hypothetical protein